ncbi:hypothetical protein [Kribbella sp. NPDC023855]|uniref:hypothetical protein n=1 Tax=Kribbella sp. NPDC023855 TaxID=3154698 RepID=UPI003406EE97
MFEQLPKLSVVRRSRGDGHGFGSVFAGNEGAIERFAQTDPVKGWQPPASCPAW